MTHQLKKCRLCQFIRIMRFSLGEREMHEIFHFFGQIFVNIFKPFGEKIKASSILNF